MYKILSDGGRRATRKNQKIKIKHKNVSSPRQCVHISHIYMVPHLTQSRGIFSPSLPHPRGLQREQTEAAGTQAEGFQGTAYFYSWLKNTSNFSKLHLFVARRAGPRGERGPCGAVVSLQRGQKPLAIGGVGGSADPYGVAGTELELR